MTMRHEDDDVDLREAFAALRREDADLAPPFRAPASGPVARTRRRARTLRALLATGALAASMVVGLWTWRRGTPAPPPTVSMEVWIAPTDFLLSTPGRELLHSVPRLVEPSSMAASPGRTGNIPPPTRRSVSP
jgi:hypothetical protein